LVVSTDSKKYAHLAEFYGAEVIDRPARLAQDDTSMIPVLQHAVKEVEKSGKKVSMIVLLDPTSPLRQIKDIEKCLELIKAPKTDSVETVCEVEHNPYYVMGKIKKTGYFQYPLIKFHKQLHRRQDAPRVHRLNAAVVVIKRDVLMAGKVLSNKTRVIVMPQERSMHIDSEIEFKFIEFLLKEDYVKLDF